MYEYWWHAWWYLKTTSSNYILLFYIYIYWIMNTWVIILCEIVLNEENAGNVQRKLLYTYMDIHAHIYIILMTYDGTIHDVCMNTM